MKNLGYAGVFCFLKKQNNILYLKSKYGIETILALNIKYMHKMPIMLNGHFNY